MKVPRYFAVEVVKEKREASQGQVALRELAQALAGRQWRVITRRGGWWSRFININININKRDAPHTHFFLLTQMIGL